MKDLTTRATWLIAIGMLVGFCATILGFFVGGLISGGSCV